MASIMMVLAGTCLKFINCVNKRFDVRTIPGVTTPGKRREY